MPVLDLMTSAGVGSLLGVRHALEPDHVAAVSTLVSRERSGLRAALLGLAWGLGHTVGLVVVGLVLVVLRMDLPGRVADVFELAVAAMLIALGARAIRDAIRVGRAVQHPPHRWFSLHTHSGLPAHLHIGTWTLARRPLLIGALHGLAGSGALTALVMATLPTTAARLAYMTLFGLGSSLGMALLSGVLGWPLARLSEDVRTTRALAGLAGSVSLGLGVAWGYPLVVKLL